MEKARMSEGLFQVRVQVPPSEDYPGEGGWLWVLPDSGEMERAFASARWVEILFWRGSNSVIETVNALYQKASAVLGCPYPPEAIGIILTELIQNALKANYKRCHFREHGIDADDPEQYEQGLITFKEKISVRTEDLFARAVRDNLHVRVRLLPEPGRQIEIHVINNSPLFPVEARRIREKLEASAMYDNIMDFLMEHQDETEGAGLGMLVITLSLREMGLPADSFTVREEDARGTVASLCLSW